MSVAWALASSGRVANAVKAERSATNEHRERRLNTLGKAFHTRLEIGNAKSPGVCLPAAARLW
jgi:hypothetical protein